MKLADHLGKYQKYFVDGGKNCFIANLTLFTLLVLNSICKFSELNSKAMV